ncbi:hypothetical protein C8T65DRAFT_716986 [Cerioporus squamosus]|nr:hypothetical protein C8T65DRAFT_716986 [Cerioporus squamosus]
MAPTTFVLPFAGSSDTLAAERYFLVGEFVVGVGYGLQIVLWTLCASYLWKQRNRGWKIVLLLAMLVALLVAETMFAITQARIIQDIYEGYLGNTFYDAQDSSVVVLMHGSLFVLTFLGDLLVLWRCWVIWSAFSTRVAVLVTSMPTLLLAASFAVGVLWIVQSEHSGKTTLPSVTAYYTISLALNVLLTSMITLRLLLYRREVLKPLPEAHTQHYLSLATIIIESAVIHTAFAVAFVTSCGLNAPINQAFEGFASAAQQVATYLIIYRVADGKAWVKQTPRSLQTMTSVNISPGRRGATPWKNAQGGTMSTNL